MATPYKYIQFKSFLIGNVSGGGENVTFSFLLSFDALLRYLLARQLSYLLRYPILEFIWPKEGQKEVIKKRKLYKIGVNV